MLALLLLVLVQCSWSQFQEHPRPITATAGDGQPVKLGCRTRGSSPCRWTRNGIPVKISPPRVRLDGCHLLIQTVLAQDAGDYTCWSGDQQSKSAKLTVYAQPGVPHIRQARNGGSLEATRNVLLQLDCESLGGRPAAELEWRKDGKRVVDLQKVTEHVTRVGDTGTWRTISTFTFLPNEVTTITCQASSSAFPEVKTSQPLEVKVRFRPKVEVMVNQDVVREGDSFEVLCKSRAYPQEVGYRWFFNGAELEGMVNNSLLIEEISRMYDQADISCLVDNEEGENMASTNLDVNYAPTILLHPRSQIAKRKDNVTFHCVAEGNPGPQYLWTRGRQDSLVQAGKQNLSLVASEKTEAVYRCQVFSDGYELVASLPASLILIRKPRLDTETEKLCTIGQDVILECVTHSVSNRTRIVWLRDLEPLDVSSSRMSVVTKFSWRRQESKLLIRDIQKDDLGNYGCFAENEVGTDIARISLSEETTNILYAVIGITLVIGILIILSIFLYVRIKRACDAGKY